MQIFPSKKSTSRALIASMIMAVVGIALIIIAETWQILQTMQSIKAILINLGALLIASLAIGFFWDLFVKRSFTEEIVQLVQSPDAYFEAQGTYENISTETTKGFYSVNWKKLIEESTEVDILSILGTRTWRHLYYESLIALKNKRAVKVRIALPNPDNDFLVSQISHRFSKKTDEIQQTLNESIEFFQNIFQDDSDKLEIILIDFFPVYGMYRFDKKMIIAIQTYRKRRPTPMLFMEYKRQKEIFQFFSSEFEDLRHLNMNNGKNV